MRISVSRIKAVAIMVDFSSWVCVCVLSLICRCSCDFWSVQCPSVPCTYTLTLSTPQEEDWWGSYAPSMEGTTVEAPDLGCPCVTVGELTTTWDTLRHRERYGTDCTRILTTSTQLEIRYTVALFQVSTCVWTKNFCTASDRKLDMGLGMRLVLRY